ncbi:MAG: hypothetical protein GY870_14935 [archaeon]|nr:hypothetical protein [archaeon]
MVSEYIEETKGITEISYIPWKTAFIALKIGSFFSNSIRRNTLPWLYGIKYNFVVKSDKIKQAGYPKDLKTTREILEEAIELRKKKRKLEISK